MIPRQRVGVSRQTAAAGGAGVLESTEADARGHPSQIPREGRLHLWALSAGGYGTPGIDIYVNRPVDRAANIHNSNGFTGFFAISPAGMSIAFDGYRAMT